MEASNVFGFFYDIPPYSPIHHVRHTHWQQAEHKSGNNIYPGNFLQTFCFIWTWLFSTSPAPGLTKINSNQRKRLYDLLIRDMTWQTKRQQKRKIQRIPSEVNFIDLTNRKNNNEGVQLFKLNPVEWTQNPVENPHPSILIWQLRNDTGSHLQFLEE